MDYDCVILALVVERCKCLRDVADNGYRQRSVIFSVFSLNVSNFHNGDPFYLQSAIPNFSRSTKIILAINISLMASITFFGNGLVILAFLLEKKLRKPRNYFLLNLSICDFFVGAFSIPLYTPYLLSGKWSFGKELCKIWLLIDAVLCFTSEYSIVLISYDRFLSITQVVKYQLQRGTRHVFIKMAAVWAISFFMSILVTMVGDYLVGAVHPPQEQCYMSAVIWSLDIATQVCTFILPFTCTTYFSFKIYWNLRRRSKQKHVNTKRPCDLERKKEKAFSGDVSCESNVAHALPAKGTSASPPPSSSSSTLPPQLTVTMNNSRRSENQSQNPLYNKGHLIHRLFNNTKIHVPSCGKHSRTSSHSTANSFKLSKDKKIAKSLAIIVSAYGMCWAPYRILMSCHTFDTAQVISPVFYEIANWLLWFNSCLNPVLYPFCHSSFKRAILKSVCLKRH
ncbi:histamine H3 receptor-like [Protopterus annectens]|uniref:histamine H3 receptor-like n=1 Tax=Protopterus annectens TaxID=7888 RepID=UPI001CFB7E9C|nr:histamine H3 receptor-like [Protopterus annectens]